MARSDYYLRAAVIFAMVAALAAVASMVLRLAAVDATAEQRARANRAEQRIAAACAAAAVQIAVTVDALDRTPAVGLALAVRDVGAVALCGGDGSAVEAAAFRGDARATRAAVLDLQRLWCPACGVAPDWQRLPKAER